MDERENLNFTVEDAVEHPVALEDEELTDRGVADLRDNAPSICELPQRPRGITCFRINTAAYRGESFAMYSATLFTFSHAGSVHVTRQATAPSVVRSHPGRSAHRDRLLRSRGAQLAARRCGTGCPRTTL